MVATITKEGTIMGMFGRQKPNPWVREIPTRIAVAGISNYQAGIARAVAATWGEAKLRELSEEEWAILVTLEHERSNPYDAMAVKVTCAGNTLGHIPREHLSWAHGAIGTPRNRSIDVNALVVVYDDRGSGEQLGVIIPEHRTD